MSDLWNEAGNQTVRPKRYFGQCFTDIFACVLEKGRGKVPFDSQQHTADNKLIAVEIEVVPFTRGNAYTIKRDMIAQFREWAGVVLPSLKVAGIDPSTLDESWVCVELVKSGDSYVKDGERVEKTTFKFLEQYTSEDECRTAAESFFGRGDEDESETEKPPMPEDAPKADNGREVAAKFLPALYAQASGDPTELGKLIAANPLTSKYFDLNSKEVTALFAA